MPNLPQFPVQIHRVNAAFHLSTAKLPILRFDINRGELRLGYDTQRQCYSASKLLQLQPSSLLPPSGSPLRSLGNSKSKLNHMVSTSQAINPMSTGVPLSRAAFPSSTSKQQREPVRAMIISPHRPLTFVLAYKNPQFFPQYTGATKAGLIRGGYHSALPDKSSGTVQANWFIAQGGGWSSDGITLPGALDMKCTGRVSSTS